MFFFSPTVVPLIHNYTYLIPPNSSLSRSCNTRPLPNMFQTQRQCSVLSPATVPSAGWLGRCVDPEWLDVEER